MSLMSNILFHFTLKLNYSMYNNHKKGVKYEIAEKTLKMAKNGKNADFPENMSRPARSLFLVKIGSEI